MRALLDVSIRSGLLPASMVLMAVACQASGSGGSSTTGRGGDGQGASSSTGAVPSLGGGLDLPGNGGTTTDSYNGTIDSDSGAEVTVTGEPKDVHLTLKAADGSPVSEGVTWSVDDTKIGSISGDGTFHANGYVGGVVTISATVGNSTKSAELTINVDITNNEGNVSAADQASLLAGGSSDGTYKFLYPYDGTVFPRGLASPLLQLAGKPATSTYTTISLDHFKYQQFSAGTPIRIQVSLPEAVWKGMTLTAGAGVDVTLTVSKLEGGQVTGPATQTYRVAQASMKGIIYYNTYDSPLTRGVSDTDKGGILRIKAGGNAEVVKRGCTVCHAVSSKGSVLATGSGYVLETYAPKTSETYDLSPDGAISNRMLGAPGLTFPFAGLTPDGSKALTNGLPANAWPTKIMRGVFSSAGFQSSLVDTKTGATIAATGLNTKYVQTPAFSPDGTKVTFLDGDKLDARVLSSLDFDDASNEFSNPNILVNSAAEAMAWPTYLPDNSAVVYHAGDSFDSYEFNAAASKPQYAEIRMVEVATKTVKKLQALNGRNDAGTLTLPYGEVVEGRMNYEPNVLPVAVGGYYWVLFTSRRTYGNEIAPGGRLEDTTNKLDPWGSDAKPSLRKKLWIAAIDVDHDSADPSHPAFYLPGQEIDGGNMRAFAAMAPCQPDGGACESGSDCCGGYCRQTSAGADGAPKLECVPPPENTCSQTDEACVSSADCCNGADVCINARCTLRSPPR